MGCSDDEDSDVVVPSRRAAPKIKVEDTVVMSAPKIMQAPSDFARSQVANWTPPVPVTSEVEALRSSKVST